jgi:6-phosphofructokinase 1
MQEKYFNSQIDLQIAFKFLTAGAKKEIYYDPIKVKAAIVTCGGICPGINVAIRSIVTSLISDYGVKEIWGVKNGYRGFYEDFPKNWLPLDYHAVQGIHCLGGSILGITRGGFELDKIVKAIEEKGINQIYVIGGDGA